MSIYETYITESLTRLRTVLDDSGTRPILFAGSGLSRRYLGSPDWLGLLEKLIKLNPIIKMPIGYYTQNTNNNLPAVASALVDEYQSYAWEQYENDVFPKELYDHSYSKSIFLKSQIAQILDELSEAFHEKGHPHSIELEILKTLKPHAIITTNYDSLLENLFPEFKVVVGQQVIRKKEATNIGHILKIHGSTGRPDEIIISEEDYELFHRKQKYLTAKLLTYFMEHPVIFLGYSVTDSNIKSILADISEIVSGDSDEVVNNIWFIEWKQEEIDPSIRPPMDKPIDLGEGKSIRVNYMLVNSFERLFESLYQDSAMGINTLRELQNNIYNIVKSKTITDLEVDIVNVQNITDENSLARLIGLSNEDSTSSEERINLMGVATIADHEQLIAMFPMRISDVADKLGLSYWYYVDKAIKQIHNETGFNLKESNNIYHVDIGIKQPLHRYSKEALELLRKVLNNEDYSIIIDDAGTEVAVTRG
ncbi:MULTISPECIES: SIR2 family protein [unclassified Bacillus (in: firmicutes)]|uniref:SIR2 family protein n=1 Tax=Bacillus TaxID=1386 RepID=UPI00115144A0|nr:MULTISPECIES: SIR2 family protein [unclassified Bacillus (in: firmicutes)]MCC2930730.1 SIR2 family protein [Bacillus sp. LBG-1-113]TQK01723.1 SIR2-like protein [Bacillus sp. SJZ110]